jgi:uncharacterized protein (UPF0276 family)
MHNYPLGSIENNKNFIGLGIGANTNKAARICRERMNSEGIYRGVRVVNLGISSNTALAPGLIDELRAAGLHTVVHLEELNISDIIDQKRLDGLCKKIGAIAPLWLEQDMGIWANGDLKLGAHMLNPFLSEEGLTKTIKNVAFLIAATGLPFLAENPPIYFNIEEIDLLQYMSRLADASGCGLVLDLGHLIGYCAATARDPFEYLDQWDGFRHVVEIHIAGYQLHQLENRFLWIDSHCIAIPEYGLALLKVAFARAAQVKVVTLEQDGATTEVERKNIKAVETALGLTNDG